MEIEGYVQDRAAALAPVYCRGGASRGVLVSLIVFAILCRWNPMSINYIEFIEWDRSSGVPVGASSPGTILRWARPAAGLDVV